MRNEFVSAIPGTPLPAARTGLSSRQGAAMSGTGWLQTTERFVLRDRRGATTVVRTCPRVATGAGVAYVLTLDLPSIKQFRVPLPLRERCT
jgi:hypothetical protein